MTSFALHTDIDPSGLGGGRVHRNEAHAPDVVEIYEYPASLGFDAIEHAWRHAPRRERQLVLSVTPYKQSAGRLFVSVRLYVEPRPAPLHIEEPAV
jgi:hypothetical protein